jgi:protein-S-isoprenylcysteine O-methyltransferase Ste14
MSLRERFRQKAIHFVGYLLPLVTSAPGVLGWVGLMAAPLIGFLIAMFANGPTAVAETVVFFTANPLNPMNLVTDVGFGISLISIIYLVIYKRRTTGFVTSGPYRYVRHPQYVGFLLLTSGLTAWSYWIQTHTFGISWIPYQATVALWFAVLAAYVGLALAEERYLLNEYGQDYLDYRESAGFFIPGVTKRPNDILTSVSVLIVLMVLLLLFSTYWGSVTPTG